jgi:serine/threonine-protein kinase
MLYTARRGLEAFPGDWDGGSEMGNGYSFFPAGTPVHRDLKPSNLILADAEDGSGRTQVKIIDFGIAKIAGEDKESSDFRTRTGTMIGTPVYMSPEQCRGVGVTARTDVYALGVILYQAIAGRPPFFSKADGDILAMHIMVPPRPLHEVAPAVPQSVSDFIGRMLAKEASERPTMLEVAGELVRLGEDPAWDAADPGTPPGPSSQPPSEPPPDSSSESLPAAVAMPTAPDTSPDPPPVAAPTQLTPPSV